MNRSWKSAWVVGGSTGLGAELVKKLAQAGIDVCVSARGAAALEELSVFASNVKAYPLDVTDQQSCVQVTTEIYQIKNTLPDIIILNAAVYTPMNVDSFDVDEVSRMNLVNYMGVVNMIAALLPFKSSNKTVTIATVTSPSGWRGLPGGIGYGSSKAAVINLIESLKPELDGNGFDLRLVNPGFIKTRLTDKNDFTMPQLMSAEEAAAKALNGLSGSSFDISFPNPFIFNLKLIRILPYRIFFWIMKKINKKKRPV